MTDDGANTPKGDAAPNWTEHHRVIPEQGEEWAQLLHEHAAPLCVAGDLNMDLGGAHYYGTKQGRAALSDALRAARLQCLTTTDRVPPGLLTHPPIDHICMTQTSVEHGWTVEAWEGTTEDGIRLSDHSGLLVDIAAAR